MAKDVQIFDTNFSDIVQGVFQAQSAFQPAFGEMQVKDGVSVEDTMFTVKATDIPVVLGSYSTDANTAFGDGTANSSRFGKMQEIIYKKKDVPYDGTWAIHEGFDSFTVNANLQAAVADRLDLQAQEKIRLFDHLFGQKLVSAAAKDLGKVDDVVKLFGNAAKEYTNMEVNVPIRAYVSPDTYNAIVDSPVVTSYKNSAVNIDENGILRLKGMLVTEVPDQYMNGAQVIFSPDNIGRGFLGIDVVRTIDAQQFNGSELQGAGKYGAWIADQNKPAILTAGYTAPTTSGSSTTSGK